MTQGTTPVHLAMGHMSLDEAMAELNATADRALELKKWRDARPTRTMQRITALVQNATPRENPPECPKCYGSGYMRVDVPVGHPQFGRPVECTCKAEEFKARRRKRFLKASNLTEDMECLNFANFQQEKQPIAYRVARTFIDNDDSKPFVVFQGVPGTGKTHLAVAIAWELLDKGETVVFKVVPDLMDWLRETFNPKRERREDDDNFADRLKDITEAPWLILDDCGAENPTPWAMEKFYQIVNHRYQHCLPTVFTTNITLLDMEERVRSRLKDKAICYTVPMEKLDYRSSEERGKETPHRKRVRRI